MKNIMVVDDSPGIRLLARMSLCNRYCVNSVSDAESAIELARIDPPDLFVLDIMLPGDLNGVIDRHKGATDDRRIGASLKR